MMHKIYLFTFLLFFTCGIIITETEDNTLLTIFQNLQKPIKITANFTQSKKIAVLENPILSKGSFLLLREHGIQFKTTEPINSTLTITSDKIIIEDHLRQKKIITFNQYLDAKESITFFFLFFNGSIEEIKKQFQLHVKGDSSQWQITLTPIKENDLIKSIQFNGNQQFVQKIKIMEASGDNTEISLTQQIAFNEINEDDKNLFK